MGWEDMVGAIGIQMRFNFGLLKVGGCLRRQVASKKRGLGL